jgi:UDP-2,3-diacylglucosamine hydrolase
MSGVSTAGDPPVVFFSDAHIGVHGADQDHRIAESVRGLLRHAREIGAEVFCLGDLFDFWFEYRHWIPKTNLTVLAAIEDYTRSGGLFHLVVGNHDYWTGDYMARELGVTVHQGDYTPNRQGLRLYLSHGDGLSPSEGGYRMLRGILRLPLNIAAYRLIPADWAYRLANFSSRSSRLRHLRQQRTSFPEHDKMATETLAAGFDAVIIGHLHVGWVRRLERGWWINTGEFFETFQYVVLRNGSFELRNWTGVET